MVLVLILTPRMKWIHEIPGHGTKCCEGGGGSKPGRGEVVARFSGVMVVIAGGSL